MKINLLSIYNLYVRKYSVHEYLDVMTKVRKPDYDSASCRFLFVTATSVSASASASSLSSLYLFDGGLHTKAEPVKWEAQQDE